MNNTHNKTAIGSSVVGQNGGLVFVFLVAATAALCIMYYGLGAQAFLSFPARLSDAADEDLVAFYRASDLLRQGMPERAYDLDVFRQPFVAVHQKLMFRNPPHFFLVIAPMAYVSYGVAKFITLLLIAVSLVVCARIARASLGMTFGLLASGAAYYGFTVLNISALPIAAIVFALFNAERRPLLSGLALAFATVKPQYGLLVPVFLVVGGYWRATGWAITFTLVAAVLASVVAGPDIWLRYLAAMASEPYTEYASFVAPGNLSIQSAAGKLGFGPGQRYALQLVGALTGAALIVLAKRRTGKEDWIAITLLASAIAAPHLLFYSWPLLCTALLILIGRHGVLPPLLQLAAGLLWAQPILGTMVFAFLPHLTRPYSIAITANILIVLAGTCWWLSNEQRNRPVSAQHPR